MIDTNQLSALISAFRVETEKESISPETVGKLLQDIVDLLATAKTDISTLQAKMRTVQGAGAVVDGASVCLIDTNRIGIQLFGYNLATGEREIELQQFFLSGFVCEYIIAEIATP